MLRFALLLSVCLLAVPSLTAKAHLGLMSPESRYGSDVLKRGPCGMGNGPRTDNVAVYEPGATIEIVWEEYVEHPGHYRIAFDADGQDDFVDPSEMREFFSNEAVLLDDIADKDGGLYRATIMLPDVECDNCTLQVIQVMYDKPPYEVGGNDIYYQCADLVLRAGGAADAGIPSSPDAGMPSTPDAGAPDAGSPRGGLEPGAGGCAAKATGGRGPGAIASALLVLALFHRRSKRHA